MEGELLITFEIPVTSATAVTAFIIFFKVSFRALAAINKSFLRLGLLMSVLATKYQSDRSEWRITKLDCGSQLIEILSLSSGSIQQSHLLYEVIRRPRSSLDVI